MKALIRRIGCLLGFHRFVKVDFYTDECIRCGRKIEIKKFNWEK